MVDLEESRAPTEAGTTIDDSIGLCRLCLRHDKSIANIFKQEITASEATADNANAVEGEAKKMPMVERLFELLGVKYEYSSSLPSNICQRCFAIVEEFTNFRENVHTCEAELQRWLEDCNKRAQERESQRPGLNGNPGEFEPEEDCIITEVDPGQDCESSEDDFSMESDSENEEQSPSRQVVQITPETMPTLTGEKTNMLDSSMVTPLAPVVTMEAQTLNTSQITQGHEQQVPLVPQPQLNNSKVYMAADILVRNTYLCQYCDMAHTTQAECQEHESQHDTAAPYVCSFCSQRTPSRQNLIYHIKELHDPERPYVCVICKKGFCRRSDLKKHTIVHTGIRPYSCPVCAKSFSRNTNLTKHIRIHNSIKPHVCTYCPRSFSSAPELLRHVRSHTSTRPFQCSRCPSTFSRKDKLQIHEQTHYRRDNELLLSTANNDGDGSTIGQAENIVVPLNPFGGDAESMQIRTSPQDQLRQQQLIAGSSLPQRSLMPKPPQTHKTSHTRIFPCTICQKTFTRERDLQRHQALHLDTLFTCKQCGTGFNRREKLARHELEFHATQYPCDICRIQFNKQDEFERHMKMHELQQNAAMATQAAISAASGMVGVGPPLGIAGVPNSTGPINLVINATTSVMAGVTPPSPVQVPKDMTTTQHHRPSAADMSFYSQLVPTMNLGFYSETRPEDRNGI